MRASPFAADFGPFDGRVWLNAAHQGPLPRPAVEALEAAVAMKRAPHAIDDGDFLTVPRELREVLGRLIGAPASEVILGNSASYGVQVLAQSTRWKPGDEVLVVQGDFLANIFPWLPFEEDGVSVRPIEPRGAVLEPDELEAALSPRTRVFCTSWVSTFTGHLADLAGLGTVCRRHGVTFVVNATQGLGRRPLDVTKLPLDALTCAGYKWLCGPYATGFAWFHPRLVESLRPRQAYWLAMPNDVELDLNDEGDYELRPDLAPAPSTSSAPRTSSTSCRGGPRSPTSSSAGSSAQPSTPMRSSAGSSPACSTPATGSSGRPMTHASRSSSRAIPSRT